MARRIKSDLRLLCESRGVSHQTYKRRRKRGFSHDTALIPSTRGKRILTPDDLRLVYAMLDDRDYHLKEAEKLTNRKIADKMGVSYDLIIKISSGARYGMPRHKK